ncbi:hypothetical protein XENTR_v10019074 [Xenopus tropicalis]|nr:hypothetical protein XENTR_v10019074 [Xenopus tropicalis]
MHTTHISHYTYTHTQISFSHTPVYLSDTLHTYTLHIHTPLSLSPVSFSQTHTSASQTDTHLCLHTHKPLSHSQTYTDIDIFLSHTHTCTILTDTLQGVTHTVNEQ